MNNYLVTYCERQVWFKKYDDAYDHAKQIRDEYNVETKIFELTTINHFPQENNDE